MRAQPITDSDALELHLAKICADSATAAVERAKTLSDNAFRELIDIAGPTGIVTAADVETTRLAADDLDLTELNQARFRYQWKLTQLQRLGLEPTTPLDLPARSEFRTVCNTSPATRDTSPAAEAVEPGPDQQFRRLSDGELEQRIRDLTTQLALSAATDAVLFRWTRTDTPDFDQRLYQHRLAADAERRRHDLAAAQAEHQRRCDLPDDQREAEELMRANEKQREADRPDGGTNSLAPDHSTDTAVRELNDMGL
ncbi:hypothetical protein [Nocardia aurantiaca]|uniref:Uncharacterized protein n=1 Tax=Nocardia aurantiaca TaxID=2675850 RepID=A0A6I3L6Z1_9NOCA|nr:hypothetical protein [Nocardia aurantiaca]MTE16275.1 hypothetical protein [Nocardia aurantiaca]